MEYVSFLDASAATPRPANPLSPARGRPAEDKTEEDSGLLSNHQSSTSLNPFACTAAFTDKQRSYWGKSAGLGRLDNPKKQQSTAYGASLAAAEPMYTEVSQRQLTSQFAGISLTTENWCASVLIAENNLVAPASATGSARTDNDGDEDAVKTFHNPPTQLPGNASRGSGILSSIPALHHETPLQKNGVPLFLRQTQPLPQTPPQKVDSRGRSQQKLRALLPAAPMRHGWEAEGFDYSPPTTQLCRDAYSGDSDDGDSSSASGFESLLSRQSERMGVFSALDFPHVRSPDWTTLSSMERDALESRLSVPSAPEEATGSDPTFVLTDVARNVVPLEVVPSFPDTTMPPIRSDARDSDYHVMRAAAPALSPNRPPVSVSAPTTRATRVPLWGAPPPVAAATPSPRARKGLLPSTMCLTKGSRFTFSAYSSSALSSGSPTPPDRSLSTSKSRRDNSTVSPLQRQRKNGSSRVPRGDEAVRDDVSTHGTLTGGTQGHANAFSTAPAAMLPRKAVMQRFCERFSALKQMFRMKPLE
ncbi:hypothetical protein CGC20_3600 [Leishmania donovani]|uniref:Uncharacterized protein n=1 Tax=Leishmania donovani TaxID=5661 RepID=A0A504X5Y8_LEIDO|nr:hypothetical protein CGC20_3600 [Leishmania donovani]